MGEKIIKEQIAELIRGFKKTFQEQTGLVLIAHADTRLMDMSLDKLMKLTLMHFEVDSIVIGQGRKHEVMVPRKLFIQAAREMGYGYQEIADVVKSHRSNIYQHEDKLNDIPGMDKMRAKYIEMLHKQ